MGYAKMMISLPEEIAEKLKRKRDKDGIPVSVQIKKALEKYLKEL
jgi:predicted DNA-binding protein